MRECYQENWPPTPSGAPNRLGRGAETADQHAVFRPGANHCLNVRQGSADEHINIKKSEVRLVENLRLLSARLRYRYGPGSPV